MREEDWGTQVKIQKYKADLRGIFGVPFGGVLGMVVCVDVCGTWRRRGWVGDGYCGAPTGPGGDGGVLVVGLKKKAKSEGWDWNPGARDC